MVNYRYLQELHVTLTYHVKFHRPTITTPLSSLPHFTLVPWPFSSSHTPLFVITTLCQLSHAFSHSYVWCLSNQIDAQLPSPVDCDFSILEMRAELHFFLHNLPLWHRPLVSFPLFCIQFSHHINYIDTRINRLIASSVVTALHPPYFVTCLLSLPCSLRGQVCHIWRMSTFLCSLS